MDRSIVYAGQVPLAAQMLTSERNTLIGLAKIAEGVLGTSTVADGLSCIPTSPASLTVQVLPGTIFQQGAVDQTNYGSLASDTVNQIIKQGINLDTKQFLLSAPGTSGQSVKYLIQAQFLESDGVNMVLPYVNSANPAVPFTGPANSGTSQPTLRRGLVAVQAKPGTAATSGSEVPPTPDAGYVPLWIVTVANGVTTINSGNIIQHPSAPFLFKKLPDLPLWVQGGNYAYALDTGTANAVVVALSPAPTALVAGMRLLIKKANVQNSGNVTVNVNGLGAVALLDAAGSQIPSANLPANVIMYVGYDGTVFRLLNGNITATTVGSLTGTSGEGITVGGSSPFPIALNYPGLSHLATADDLDIWSFYNQSASHHRQMTTLELAANITSRLSYGSFFPFAIAAGSANALTVTFPTPFGSLSNGQAMKIRAASNNTGAATLQVDSLTALPIVRANGNALLANDLVAGEAFIVIYDQSKFVLQTSQIPQQDLTRFAIGSYEHTGHGPNVPPALIVGLYSTNYGAPAGALWAFHGHDGATYNGAGVNVWTAIYLRIS